MERRTYYWPNRVVLVVEDDFLNYQYIEILLKDTGLKIIHVQNGEDAVSLCSTPAIIDVVLMDIQLPFMSGYETMKQVKSIRKKLPVIIQTGNLVNEDVSLTYEKGCNCYVAKPIDPEELYTAISKCLDDCEG
jgi:two-component system, cell cycle response regulator DivK